jgi:hypothetical protein
MLVSGLDSEINSSGNSTILVVSVISNLPELNLDNVLASIIFSLGASINLNSFGILLPLLSHTQQCHLYSPLSL